MFILSVEMSQRPQPLAEVSPSTLNRTAFPANSKKRAYNSPSQSPNSNYSLSPSTKQQSTKPNINLKRSSGILNLSTRGSSNLSIVTASPSTSRIIQSNHSKNEEMLKSFNELSFDRDIDMDVESENDTPPNQKHRFHHSKSYSSLINLPKKMFPLHKHSLSSIITSSNKPINTLSISSSSSSNSSSSRTSTTKNSSRILDGKTSTPSSQRQQQHQHHHHHQQSPMVPNSNIKKSSNIFGSIPLRSSSSASSSSNTTSSISPFFKHDEPIPKKTKNYCLNSSTPRKQVEPLNLSNRSNQLPSRRIASAPISTNGHYVTPFNKLHQSERLPSSASLSSVKPLLSVFSSSGLISKSDKSFRDHQREKWKSVPETPMKKGLRDVLGSRIPTPKNASFSTSLGTSIENTTLNTTMDNNGSYSKSNWINPSPLNNLDNISPGNLRMDLNDDDEEEDGKEEDEDETFRALLSDLNPPKFYPSLMDNESPTIKKSKRFQIGLLSEPGKGTYWQRAGSQQSLVNTEHYQKPMVITNLDNSTSDSLGPKTPVESFKRPLAVNSQPPLLHWSSSIVTDVGNTSDIQKMEIDSHLYEKFGNCSLVGNGEFSVVYAVEFKGIKYAVKKTKDQILGPKKRKRLWEEVELLKEVSSLNDKNQLSNDTDNSGNDYVVTLISAWEFNNQLYIMTDYCENGTLDKFLLKQTSEGSRSRLDEWRIWKILVELMFGLSWIHKHEIIHLDLKPANIFITFDGTLKIGDFGVGVKLPINNNNGDFDREGDREYIAPEIISVHGYSTKADIFSVGLIMLETAANVVLPENGSPWRKLRSGDLSDAGRLSSGELSKRAHVASVTTRISDEGIMGDGIDSISAMDYSTPVWFYDGSGSLDKIVNWMMSPNPINRPSAMEILSTWECSVVEFRRKSGATIYEGDFGPAISEKEMEKENDHLKMCGAKRVSELL